MEWAPRWAVGPLRRGRPARHDGRVVLGASQGGHAVYAVERYAPYYAPEFELIAAVTLIAPGDLLSQTEDAFLEYGTTARGVLISLITLGDWYGLWPRISEVIRDDDAFPIASWLRAEMEKVCYPTRTLVSTASMTSLRPTSWRRSSQMIGRGLKIGAAARATSPLSYYLPRVNDTPMLQVLSESDTLVDLKVERETFRQLCDSDTASSSSSVTAGYTGAQGGHHRAVQLDRRPGRWFAARNPCIAAAPTCCSETPEGTCDNRGRRESSRSHGGLRWSKGCGLISPHQGWGGERMSGTSDHHGVHHRVRRLQGSTTFARCGRRHEDRGR